MSQSPQDGNPSYNRDLINRVAGGFRTPRRDDLKAALAAHSLKVKPPADTDDIAAFLGAVLWRKASNLIRNERLRDTKEVPLETETHPAIPRERSLLDELALRESISKAALKLPPKKLLFLEAFIATDGDIGRAADLCGIHRNTGSAWLQSIRATFADIYSCTDLDCASADTSGPSQSQETMPSATTIDIAPRGYSFVAVPTALLESLMLTPGLSGTQFRLLLWVMRNTYGWRRGTTAFSWYGIAQALHMDRGGTVRAGNELIKTSVLIVANGPRKRRIGFPAHFAAPQAKTPMSGDIPKSDDEQHRKRCLQSALFRRAKDRSKDIKNNTAGGKPPQWERGQGRTPSNNAGAAKPIPGKVGIRLTQVATICRIRWWKSILET